MIKINNYILDTSVKNILLELKSLTHNQYFKDIKENSNSIMFTCPFHANHSEKHPSCGIITNTSSDKEGIYHCFTCGSKGTIGQLVAYVLDISEEQANTWLIESYGNLYSDSTIFFPEWEQKKPKNKLIYLNENILNNFRYYHPYLEQRKVSFEIAKKFLVGYNFNKNTITFPVWDENDNLVMITERSVSDKKFYIQEGIEKPVYLLNFVLKEKNNQVIICEGQIDALVAQSYGFPAVALIGAGTTDKQMEILNKSGIQHFILMYDNDFAGRKGATKFKDKIRKDCFVTDIIMPVNKDVADLSKEEFYNILKNNNVI